MGHFLREWPVKVAFFWVGSLEVVYVAGGCVVGDDRSQVDRDSGRPFA